MNGFNVLLLSSGRRVELVQHFKNAVSQINKNSCIVAADFDNTAPSLYFADKKYIVPKVTEDSYIEAIVNICLKESISIVIPTIDSELLILAKHKEYIETTTNAVVMISDYDVVDICRDKIKSQKFFENNNFGVPIMYSATEIYNLQTEFPLFIKPKSGSSSRDVFKINNIEEFEIYSKIVPDYIVQEFVSGEEYTVDVFNDFEANVITIVPRLRMATRSGEISKGKIVKDPVIIEDIKRLMSVLKPKGHVTVQLMKTDDGLKYIEINPRFGGGAPMSIESGADSCTNLLKLLQGEKLEYNEDFKENLIFLRYDSSICLNDQLEDLND